MRLVIKVLSDQVDNKSQNDSGKFWAKVEFPNGKSGFTQAEVSVDKTNFATLHCPRVAPKNFFSLINPKHFPKGALVSLAYCDNHFYELWSAEVMNYVGVDEKGMDTYEVGSFRQEMNHNERSYERKVVNVPVKLENYNLKFSRSFSFHGCDLTPQGVGVWVPRSIAKRINFGEKYKLTFAPKEVEPFKFIVECVRPHSYDEFSKGCYVGFAFLEPSAGSIEELRVRQLIEARGRLATSSNWSTGHYLSNFWGSEGYRETF
jgi:hypothetical protein